MTIVLALDPGSRNTGVVVRQGDTLLAHALLVRQDTGRLPDGRYLAVVRTGCTRLLTDAGVDYRQRDTYIVGVEGLRDWPERDGRRRNQNHLYGTAMVLGAVLARWPSAVMVDSGRGAAMLHPSAYPPDIRPPVNGKGKDRLSHVRAAWDHSHATEVMWKQTHRESRR